jgi:hypothetical protein
MSCSPLGSTGTSGASIDDPDSSLALPDASPLQPAAATDNKAREITV